MARAETSAESYFGAISPEPPERRWALLYDADCGFCKCTASALLRWDRHHRVQPRALQSEHAQSQLSELSPQQRLASVHLISPDGERFSGGSALAPLVRLLPGGTLPALALARLEGATDRAYDWVAEHRSLLSRAIPASMKRRASERLVFIERERRDDPPGTGLG